MTKLQIFGLIALCIFIFLGIEVIALHMITTEIKIGDEAAETKPKEIKTETGDKVIITRIGTSSIKKLDLERGSIYFTDGWAVYIKQGE